MSIGLTHYLVLASVLFCIGLYGALAKRNAVGILMSIELMLSAACLTLIAFSRYVVVGKVLLTGHIFVVFIMVVAAAEAAVGLAIILSIYRRRRTVDVDEVNLMKW